MSEFILVIHLLIALALIGVVLLQRSEGGALGIGGGGGGALFSSRGVGNALTRATAMLAVAFFITSITLTILARGTAKPPSVLDQVQSKQQQKASEPATAPQPTTPATPATPKVPVSE